MVQRRVRTAPLNSLPQYAELQEEYTFAKPVGSVGLVRESILSCFSVLSDTATGKTATFKQTAVDTAFETSQGAADGSTSPEWLALVDTKSNWTISLV